MMIRLFIIGSPGFESCLLMSHGGKKKRERKKKRRGEQNKQ